MKNFLLFFVRFVFLILNGIALAAFVLPYILTVNEKGESFSSHLLFQPYSWILLVLWIILFPLKFQSLRNIRKNNLSFGYEFLIQCFWLFCRGYLAGLWIFWIMNNANFNNDVMSSVIFASIFFGMIFWFSWMYYGKKMRAMIEKNLDDSLAKILKLSQSANKEDIVSFDTLFTNSKLYNENEETFSEVILGLPTRGFSVRYRRWYEKIYSRPLRETSSDYHLSERKKWKFYFTVLSQTFSLKGNGVYSLNQFTKLVNAEKARNYKLGLKNFKVQKIEISENGLVIAIKPKFHIASMGIVAPSIQDLENLFKAFER